MKTYIEISKYSGISVTTLKRRVMDEKVKGIRINGFTHFTDEQAQLISYQQYSKMVKLKHPPMKVQILEYTLQNDGVKEFPEIAVDLGVKVEMIERTLKEYYETGSIIVQSKMNLNNW